TNNFHDCSAADSACCNLSEISECASFASVSAPEDGRTPLNTYEADGGLVIRLALARSLGRLEACPTLRFMDSLLSLLRRHWVDEPRNWSAGLRPGAGATQRQS